MLTAVNDQKHSYSMEKRMVKSGNVIVEQFGDVHLTEKGRRVYERILNRMTTEEKLILQIGLANDRGTPIHF